MNKAYLAIASLIVIAILAFGVYQTYKANQAHSTFENYYAFRGCSQLLEKTDTYGRCVTSDGQTIKIVLYSGKWYLDGDLPCPGSPLSLKYLSCLI